MLQLYRRALRFLAANLRAEADTNGPSDKDYYVSRHPEKPISTAFQALELTRLSDKFMVQALPKPFLGYLQQLSASTQPSAIALPPTRADHNLFQENHQDRLPDIVLSSRHHFQSTCKLSGFGFLTLVQAL